MGKPVALLRLDTRSWGPASCEKCEDEDVEDVLLMPDATFVCPECMTPIDGFDEVTNMFASASDLCKKQMFEFAHNEDLIEKGQWMASLDKALISCPTCGKFESLGNHEISQDGTVSPSIVCPWAPCVFHDTGKLKDWKP